MRWKAVIMVALLAGALAGQPRHAVAQVAGDDATVEHFDSEKFWDYAACGLSVAFAAGTQAWWVAGIACGRALTRHVAD